MNNDNNPIRDEEDEMNENNELAPNLDTQEESMENSDLDIEVNSAIPENWIKVQNGKFVCAECENESKPETNTVDGTVEADTEKIKNDLMEVSTKIVYGSCPICGMEYVFKVKDSELYMEPSDMVK